MTPHQISPARPPLAPHRPGRPSTLTRAWVALLVLVMTLVLAACGGGDGGRDGDDDDAADPSAAPRAMFVATCGGCHTLADAETTGTVGPRLDDRKLASETVAAKIEQGGGGMPAALLSGADADEVAGYVADASG